MGTRTIVAAVVAGIAVMVFSFVMHGMILGNTYMEHDVFTKEEANPVWFLVIEVAIAFTAALLFVKTRSTWGDGAKGGAVFGFYIGLLSFFPPFFNSLIFEGFPYFLGWCWGSINLMQGVLIGTVLGAMIKNE